MSLVLIGAGGHAKVVAETAQQAGFTVRGVLTPHGVAAAMDLSRLGDDSWIETTSDSPDFHIAFGPAAGSTSREVLFERVRARGFSLPTLVSPHSIVSPRATVAEATLVVAGAVVNPDAVVGRNCIVNTSAIVEHDVTVGDHSHLGPRSVLCGGVRLGRGVIVGAGAVILPGLEIADGVVVGAGSVVTRSVVEAGSVVWGAPGRRQR